MPTPKKKSQKRSAVACRSTSSANDLQNMSSKRKSFEGDLTESQAANLVKQIEDRKEALLEVINALVRLFFGLFSSLRLSLPYNLF